jgi:hypothetical protein
MDIYLQKDIDLNSGVSISADNQQFILSVVS